MAHDVFISHANADKTTADTVCALLERDGFRCWMAPRDIPPGADWGHAIVEAIRTSRVMVVVFSAAANGSKHIPREVERAISNSVPIIPFRIEAVMPHGPLEYSLSSLHWLDALTPPLERHIAGLSTQIRGLLGDPVRPQPGDQQPESQVEKKPRAPREPWHAGHWITLAMVVVAVAAVGSQFVTSAQRKAAAEAIRTKEQQVVRWLKAIHSAQTAYSASCGNGGWASTWAQLTTPVVPGSAPYLVEAFPPGYEVLLVEGPNPRGSAIDERNKREEIRNDCLARPTWKSFWVIAASKDSETSDLHSFGMRADGEIWQVQGRYFLIKPGPPGTKVQ